MIDLNAEPSPIEKIEIDLGIDLLLMDNWRLE